MTHLFFESPLGTIALQGDEESLARISFLGTEKNDLKAKGNKLLAEVKRQILAYLKGELKSFDLPLHYQGTTFQEDVWKQMALIPFGELLTYGELASLIERPKAVRAVGGAANKNPLPLVIPCHRVVGAAGKLVGFAPGLSYKRHLLSLEGHKTDENSVT